MKMLYVELEMNGKKFEFTDEEIKPLTRLQVEKMFGLLQTVDGFRVGLLETLIYIEVEGDNFKIKSSPFDVWGEGVEYQGNLTELNKMNTYENRFIDSVEMDSNPMSVSFEYEVIDGVVSDPTEDSHYGSQILSNEETIKIVEKLMSDKHISNNENGMIDVYDDMIVVHVFEFPNLLIPR